MKSFRHAIPSLRIHQGAGCLDQLEAELERVGSRRGVILCGSTLARAGSPMDAVRKAMDNLRLESRAAERACARANQTALHRLRAARAAQENQET